MLLESFALRRANGEYFLARGRCKMPAGTPGQHPRSTHISGLAQHYIIYDQHYNWMHDVDKVREAEIYKELHEYWEEWLGGAKAIPGDANHFSMEHHGVR